MGEGLTVEEREAIASFSGEVQVIPRGQSGLGEWRWNPAKNAIQKVDGETYRDKRRRMATEAKAKSALKNLAKAKVAAQKKNRAQWEQYRGWYISDIIEATGSRYSTVRNAMRRCGFEYKTHAGTNSKAAAERKRRLAVMLRCRDEGMSIREAGTVAGMDTYEAARSFVRREDINWTGRKVG